MLQQSPFSFIPGLLPTILIAFIFQYGSAQSYFGVTQMTGKIIKHDVDIPLDVPQNVFGLELSYRKKLVGSEHWKSFWNQPHFDLSLGYSNFNNSLELGHAFSISPGLQFFFFQRKRVQLGLRVNIGLAYINKIYDINTNPNNTYIGSYFNDTNQFVIAPRFKINKQINLDLGLSFTHYSNGGLSLPNKGINMYRGFIGLYYSGRESVEDNILVRKDSFKESSALKKYGVIFQASAGITRSLDFPDQQFGIYSLSSIGYFKVNPFQSWLGGLEFEYNPTWSYFEENTQVNLESPTDAAACFVFYLGHELQFGPAVLRIGSGLYLEKEKRQRIEPCFFKLQIGTKIPFGNRALGLGLSLKSHYFRAENISFYTSFYF